MRRVAAPDFSVQRASVAAFGEAPCLLDLDRAMRLRARSQRKVAKETTEVTTEGATKDSMSDTRSDLTVSLWRGAQQGRYESYKVPWRENQTVLDVISTRRCRTALPAAWACAAPAP